jgi:hypothetical protein
MRQPSQAPSAPRAAGRGPVTAPPRACRSSLSPRTPAGRSRTLRAGSRAATSPGTSTPFTASRPPSRPWASAVPRPWACAACVEGLAGETAAGASPRVRRRPCRLAPLPRVRRRRGCSPRSRLALHAEVGLSGLAPTLWIGLSGGWAQPAASWARISGACLHARLAVCASAWLISYTVAELGSVRRVGNLVCCKRSRCRA